MSHCGKKGEGPLEHGEKALDVSTAVITGGRAAGAWGEALQDIYVLTAAKQIGRSSRKSPVGAAGLKRYIKLGGWFAGS